MNDEAAIHDARTEVSLLGVCLFNKLARDNARRYVTGPDFWVPAHERLWDLMVGMDRAKAKVDETTVMAKVNGDRDMMNLILAVMSAPGIVDHAAEYANTVREWSMRRKVISTARGVIQDASRPGLDVVGFTASTATKFAAIRDSGVGAEDITAVTLGELLASEDDEPDWLIPNLLERRDRFMLTGQEGLGKSHLLRQFALHAAGGLNPLDARQHITPIRTLIYDCENSYAQVKRKVRPAAAFVKYHGADPSMNCMVEATTRIDITRDRDLARIHLLLDVHYPSLVVIGPLYRLTPGGINSDDDATPVLAALDTIRDRGCALMIEAHAGHATGAGGLRDLRPRGSSALLGWPEFGFGMRGAGSEGYADLIPWRGQREERNWPKRVKREDGHRWMPYTRDLSNWGQGGAA